MINLSIIIPIYKAAAYIEKCARSLFEQSLTDNIEFIFINDCTPDNSMIILENIIKEYPHRIEQIRIINNSINIGISEVRKQGVRNALGLYIGWCDSDDWVEPNMYYKLLDTAINTHSEIVVCNYCIEKEQGVELFSFYPSNSPKECIQKLYKKRHFSYVLWNQIIKKEKLLYAYDSPLVPVDVGEDLYTLIITYFYSKTITFIPNYLYHYRILSNSLSKRYTRSLEKFYDHQQNIDYIKKTLKYNLDNKFKTACNCITFGNKMGFKTVFSIEKEWFYYHKECHKDIIKFTNYPLISRLKTWIIFSNYLFYNIYHKIAKTQG